MNGEIGTLNQKGKQIGGVFDWGISGNKASWAKDNWVETKATKLVTVKSYWLINKPEGDVFEIELYQQIRNQLVLVDISTVKLNLPDTDTLDRKLSTSLRWTG